MRRRYLPVLFALVVGAAVGHLAARRSPPPPPAGGVSNSDPLRVEITSGPQEKRSTTRLKVMLITRPGGAAVDVDRDWSAPPERWYYLALDSPAGRTVLHCTAE